MSVNICYIRTHESIGYCIIVNKSPLKLSIQKRNFFSDRHTNTALTSTSETHLHFENSMVNIDNSNSRPTFRSYN